MPETGPCEAVMSEPIFTASEVQSAITAVVLYERSRAEQQMREASAIFTAAIKANRRDLGKRAHRTLDELARDAYNARQS